MVKYMSYCKTPMTQVEIVKLLQKRHEIEFIRQRVDTHEIWYLGTMLLSVHVSRCLLFFENKLCQTILHRQTLQTNKKKKKRAILIKNPNLD